MVESKSILQAFLAECEHEFADRYTLEDAEFQAIADAKIPPPPIMTNWYPRNKRNAGGRGGGGGRYRDFRDRRSDFRYNNRHDYGRSYDRSGSDDNHWDQRDQRDYRDREPRDSYRERPR